MTLVFNDTATLEVNINLLTSCKQGQFLETEKRPIGSKNLFWWFRCYPRKGSALDTVSASIHTSFGGFHIRHVTTIDGTDVKESADGYHEKPLSYKHLWLADHKKLKYVAIMHNNVFVIRCKVSFEIVLDEPRIDNIKNPIIEDTVIIKLNRKTLKAFNPGQQIDGEKRVVADSTWWTKHYPCGFPFEDDYNVDVFFFTDASSMDTYFFCGLSIGGAFVQQSLEKYAAGNQPISYSHKQLQNVDHINDIVDLVCKIVFIEPVTAQIKAINSATSFKDSVTFSIMECQQNVNDVGDFDSTPKRFAEGSDKHKWRVLYFPVGILEYAKNHIGLIVEASTTDTKTVIMSGEITIHGTSFSKKFRMFVEEDSNNAFPKLISHEELRRIGGIVDQQITITCAVVFETQT